VSDFPAGQEDRQATLAAARFAAMQLPERPRLAPWLVAVDLGDARLQLRSAESAHTLSHPLLTQVFRTIEKSLDGRHTVAEIAASAGADVLPTTVVFLLKLLQGRGLLQPGFDEITLDEGEQKRWRRQLTFLSQFVPDAANAQSMLAKARVGVIGSDELRRAIAGAIGATGVGVSEPSEPSSWYAAASGKPPDLDLMVACQEDLAFTYFDGINRACLASGTRWLRVTATGTSAQLGPTVVPNQTACYTCFDLRLRANQPDLEGYLAYQAHNSTPGGRVDPGSTAPLLSLIAGQVALEVMRLLIGFAPPVTVGRFYEFSVGSPVAISHDVLRGPRCASCGRERTLAEAWDRSFTLKGIGP
jgi:bacteriocin biosynthesis cyclodehydratase domain-containing protein